MNYMRTAILLAGLTGLFMAVGYLIGGGSGALIALIIAAVTNLLSYWNADKLVLSTRRPGGRRAQCTRAGSDRARAGAIRGYSDAAGLCNGQRTAQCFRRRKKSATCRSLRYDGAHQYAQPRRNRGVIGHELARPQSRHPDDARRR